MTKLCSRCNQIKPLTNFSITRRKSAGVLRNGSTFKRAINSVAPEIEYHAYCKACNSAYAREFRKRYKAETGNSDYRGSGKVNKYPKEDRPLMSAIRKRITSTKGNCKRSNTEFSVDEEYLYKIFKEQHGKCALTAFPMALDGNTNLRLSIDRIDARVGYHPGNVQWTIFAANRAKGDLTNEDFIKLCRLVVERATTIESTSNH